MLSIIHSISDAISSVSPQVLGLVALGVEWLCRRLPTQQSIGIIAGIRSVLGVVRSVVDELDRLVVVVDGVVEKVLPENQAASLPQPPAQ